jgi:uncharacterized membrane protein
MIDANLFIGAVIVALVQAIKEVFPGVQGAITTIVAALVGALIALLAPHIGVVSVSIAMGVLDGLAAAGVHTVVTNSTTPKS